MKYKRFSAFIAAAMILLCVGCKEKDKQTDNAALPEVVKSAEEVPDDIDDEQEETTVSSVSVGSGLSAVRSSDVSASAKNTSKTTAADDSVQSVDSGSSSAFSGNGSYLPNAQGSGGSDNSSSDSQSGGSPEKKPSQNGGSASGTGSTGSGGTSNETQTETPDRAYITLDNSAIRSDGNGSVSIDGNTVTITAEGKYEFSGTMDNGQIIVNAGKESKVDIYLNGVGLTCSGSAPIYVMSADTCTLHLAEGSSNYVRDTASNSLSACIFSKDDLTIKGGGSLSVIGSKKHGIKSSNDVKIKNGNISVSCLSTGIYGEDSVQITGGSMVVSSCKDGIKSSNSEDTEKGFVLIEDGYVDIQNAVGNGIDAVNTVTINGGTINIHSEKKALKCTDSFVADGCLNVY